jgi:hypothetical protein
MIAGLGSCGGSATDGIPNEGFSLKIVDDFSEKGEGLTKMAFGFSNTNEDVVHTSPGVYEICWCGNRHPVRGPWWESEGALYSYKCESVTEYTASLGTLAVRGPLVENNVVCIRGQSCYAWKLEGSDFYDAENVAGAVGADRLLVRVGVCRDTWDLNLETGEICNVPTNLLDPEVAMAFPMNLPPQDHCIVQLMNQPKTKTPNGYSEEAYNVRNSGAEETLQFVGTTRASPTEGNTYTLCWASGRLSDSSTDLMYFEATAGTMEIYGAYNFQHAVCARGAQCRVQGLEGVSLRNGDRLRVVALPWSTVADSCADSEAVGIAMSNSSSIADQSISELALMQGTEYAFGADETALLTYPVGVYQLCFCNVFAWGESGEKEQDIGQVGRTNGYVCQSGADFPAAAGQMHIAQRFGCVVGQPCFLPVPRSFLAPVNDNPDLGTYLFSKQDENSQPNKLLLNETFFIQAFAVLTLNTNCNEKGRLNAGTMIDEVEGFVGPVSFFEKYAIEMFDDSVGPTFEESVEKFVRSAKFPVEPKRYQLCAVSPSLSFVPVNLQRKRHHLLTSDIPEYLQRITVCPENSAFDELDGQCKCMAGLYMQYKEQAEVTPWRCVRCGGEDGEYNPEEPPLLGYFCPYGSKRSEVLASQSCAVDRGVGFTTGPFPVPAVYPDLTRDSNEDCMCDRGMRFDLQSKTCMQCGEGVFKDVVGNLDTCPNSCMDGGSSAREAKDILDCFCNSGFIIALDEDGRPKCLPCPTGRFCTGGIRAREATFPVQHTLALDISGTPSCQSLREAVVAALGLPASTAECTEDEDTGETVCAVQLEGVDCTETEGGRRLHPRGRRLGALTVSLSLSGEDAKAAQEVDPDSYGDAFASVPGASVSGVSTAMSDEDFYNSLSGTEGACNANAAAPEGAISAEDCLCVPGYTVSSNSGGTVTCKPCGQGFYKSTTTNDACTRCLPFETTIGVTSFNSSSCICESGRYRAARRIESGGGNATAGQSFCVECGCDAKWDPLNLDVCEQEGAPSWCSYGGGVPSEVQCSQLTPEAQRPPWCATPPSWCLLSARMRNPETGDKDPCPNIPETPQALTEQGITREKHPHLRDQCDSLRGEFFCSHNPAAEWAVDPISGIPVLPFEENVEPVPVKCPYGMRRGRIESFDGIGFFRETSTDCMCRPGWGKVPAYDKTRTTTNRTLWRVRIAGLGLACGTERPEENDAPGRLPCLDRKFDRTPPPRTAVKLSAQKCPGVEDAATDVELLADAKDVRVNGSSVEVVWFFEFEDFQTVGCVFLNKEMIAPGRWVSEGHVTLEAFMVNEYTDAVTDEQPLLKDYPRYAVPDAVSWWKGYDEMEGGIQSFWAPVGLWYYNIYQAGELNPSQSVSYALMRAEEARYDVLDGPGLPLLVPEEPPETDDAARRLQAGNLSEGAGYWVDANPDICFPCEPGTFKPKVTAEGTCGNTCPTSSTSFQGASSVMECFCAINFVRDVTKLDALLCRPCPKGLFCPGIDEPFPFPNFFMIPYPVNKDSPFGLLKTLPVQTFMPEAVDCRINSEGAEVETHEKFHPAKEGADAEAVPDIKTCRGANFIFDKEGKLIPPQVHDYGLGTVDWYDPTPGYNNWYPGYEGGHITTLDGYAGPAEKPEHYSNPDPCKGEACSNPQLTREFGVNWANHTQCQTGMTGYACRACEEGWSRQKITKECGRECESGMAILITGLLTLNGQFFLTMCNAIVIAGVTAQSAESVEKPLHSVILKLLTNYGIAVGVLAKFDIRKLEKQKWVVEAEKRYRMMGIEGYPEMPEIPVPPEAERIKNTLTSFKPPDISVGVDEMFGCLVPGRFARYFARASFHLLSPLLYLGYTTLFCLTGFLLRKPLGKLVAIILKKKPEKATGPKAADLTSAPKKKAHKYFLSVWRIPEPEDTFFETIRMFFADMFPIYLIVLFYVWQPVTEEMLLLQSCNQMLEVNYYDPETGEPNEPPFALGESEPRWDNDADILCGMGTPDHGVITIIFFLGMMTWTFGMIAFAMFLLSRQRENLHEVTVLRRFGFLYLGYEHQWWFWESVKRMQQLAYGLVSTLPASDDKARLIMYCMLSGSFAILHVLVQPFDDRNNQMLDMLETKALVVAFSTQVLFQTLITFPMTLVQIIVVLMTAMIINGYVIQQIGTAFVFEILAHMGKKALTAEEERIRLQGEVKKKRDLEMDPKERPPPPSSQSVIKEKKKKGGGGGRINLNLWNVLMLQIGYMDRRRNQIRSRLCLLNSLEGNLMSRMVARTPVSRNVRWKFIVKKQPIPEEEPVMVSEDDKSFFWLIQRGMLDVMLNNVGWDVVDGDLYEFMLRLMVALVIQERFMRGLGKQMDAKVRVELHEMLKVPVTEVSALNEMIRVAEDEGRQMSFSEACERYIPRNNLIAGDELFRAKEYAAVMDRDVLLQVYGEWKKNKLCRILPAVMRETYEKILEDDADATQRMMRTDPVWADWTQQMNSQVHGALGAVPPQRKLKYAKKPQAPANNKISNAPALPSNVVPTNEKPTEKPTEDTSKIPSFDDQIAALLSSAAVDQAAEEMYRRSAAETDAFEALNRSRLGNAGSGNVHGASNALAPIHEVPSRTYDASIAPVSNLGHDMEEEVILPPPAEIEDIELEGLGELDGLDDDILLPPPEDFETNIRRGQ